MRFMAGFPSASGPRAAAQIFPKWLHVLMPSQNNTSDENESAQALAALRSLQAESKEAKKDYGKMNKAIENNSNEASQLLNRHWIITDGQGDIEEVQGPGVVGQQPRIQPGEGFRYSSGAILKTPVGVMQGKYEFVTDAGHHFDVEIPQFSLAVSALVH